jgi:uncharacterized membrane protein YdjX (TVP38/TMEM64 family)
MSKNAYRFGRPALCRISLACVLACTAAVAWYYLPEGLAMLANWPHRASHLGVWGPTVMALVCVPSAVLMVPSAWITLLGSFTFGMARSLVPLSLGHLLGACAAFLVSRYLARGWVERRLATSARLKAIDRAVGEQGFKIVFLSRLSPLLPFGVLSYTFGLTRISLRRYALATWLGMSPGTLLYVYLGAAAKEVADVLSGRAVGGSAARALFFAGLIATLAVSVVVTRVATAALREAMHSDRE